MDDEAKNSEAAEAGSSDLRWMRRALELAQRGVGLSSPNPAVGCVLVAQDGLCIGEGWHEYARRDHAEIVALRQAGERACGATAYVTLEPCSHTGRTGPCAVALREAGLKRVVVTTMDPNPLVAGKGIAQLREAGISVDCGVLEGAMAQDAMERAARRINEGFARWIQTGRPFVTQKVAMTLDGRIAPPGEPPRTQSRTQWITSEASRAEVQRMRHSSDSLLTGIGTILADDPLLTDRSGLPRRRRLLRVILDSRLRLPLESRIVASAEDDVLVCTASEDARRIAELRARGLRVEQFSPASDGRLPLDAVFALLGERQMLTVMTECGSALNAALLSGGFVDRCTCFLAPQILGSDAMPAWGELANPFVLDAAEWSAVGRDWRVSALLCDPWPAKQPRAETID